MTTYNHMFTVAFTVKSSHAGTDEDPVGRGEIKAALLSRTQDLDKHDEWLKATGAPVETYIEAPGSGFQNKATTPPRASASAAKLAEKNVIVIEREKLEQALKALEDLGMKHYEKTGKPLYKETFNSIQAALEEPVQKPVAVINAWNLREVYFDANGEPSMHRDPPAQLARPVKPLTGDHTTFVQRFTDAVAMMCGAEPPPEFVDEWLRKVEVNFVARLQEWVLCQDGAPEWAQGVGVLDAAYLLADSPVEGLGHKDRIEANELTDEPEQETDRPTSVPKATPPGLVEALNEASEILSELTNISAPHNMRWPLVDELRGFALMMAERMNSADEVEQNPGPTLDTQTVVRSKPNPEESALELSPSEAQAWQDYGETGRNLNLRRDEMAALLVTTGSALNDLRTRVKDALNTSTLERDAYILATRVTRDGELEVDASAFISTGDDNGAYVSAWRWISFYGTPLDQENQADDISDKDGDSP
jgi:hypothetical protein